MPCGKAGWWAARAGRASAGAARRTRRAQPVGPIRRDLLVRPGVPAPDFRLPDPEGTVRSPRDYRGRPLLLLFLRHYG